MLLYKTYLEHSEKGTFTKLLKGIYEKGSAVGFKAPSKFN